MWLEKPDLMLTRDLLAATAVSQWMPLLAPGAELAVTTLTRTGRRRGRPFVFRLLTKG
jgi:hypothetical protein